MVHLHTVNYSTIPRIYGLKLPRVQDGQFLILHQYLVRADLE